MKENNKEVWKPIIGYEGLYEFSNLQRVCSVDRVVTYNNGTRHIKGKLLTISTTQDGYRCVGLSKNKKHKTTYIHQLAWEYFNGVKVPDGLDVNHKDSNRQNNDPSNLEVVSHKANCNAVDNNGKTPAQKRWENPAWVAHNKKMTEILKKFSKQVTAVNLDTYERTTYNSVTDAQEDTKVARSTIKKINDNKQYQSNGYAFLYDDKTNLIYHKMKFSKLSRPEITNAKHVSWDKDTTANYYDSLVNGKD